LADGDPRKAIHARYGLTQGASERRWENFHDRFDISKEPNEPFRFGWVIEVDPFDPHSKPRKLTALGRMKHEAATVVISKRGHAVVYTGDDERFDYMYKFVSERRFRGGSCRDNHGLLDSGVLYVAKFNDDGSGQWIPLVAGQGALANWTQAEILINTRGAADQVGATKMDRPEDIETNPANGKLYCVMTNNTQRGTSGRPGTDAANPRANNRHGHVIELTEDRGDPASNKFEWEIFLLCGDPNNPADGTFFGGFEGSVSSISSPDNIAFDSQGNLWIATDGQPGTLAKNDAIYAVPVEGPDRGWLRQFMSGPLGCEVCGPEFTPDNLTLFCAIQHPGEGGTVNNPVSVWPDGVSPARPSVVAIFNSDDDVIGA
jgi:secreted PhoX family phosphatase